MAQEPTETQVSEEPTEDELDQGGWPWDGEGEPDDYDPELIELGEAAGRDSVLRPILMLGVLVMGALIISDWREELAYYFSPSEPVALGDVTDFPVKASEDPNWSPDIPHNRYVEARGLPSKRTLSKHYKYFKLIGGEIYVEARRDDADLSELERIEQGTPKADADRSYFAGAGRALSFSAMPKRYATLRQYYSRNYGVAFCVDLDEQARAQIERKRRETIQQMWRKRWEEATPAEREAKHLTQAPTVDEVEQLMSQQPVCVDAWLIQAGRAPSDHWWYLALASLFGLFMLIDLVFLIRWTVRFLKPRDGL